MEREREIEISGITHEYMNNFKVMYSSLRKN